MATDRYKYFRVEARDLLEQLGKGVLELDRGQPARLVVSRLLRLAHTLKGAARVVAQPEVALAAHSIEDLFEEYRDTEGPVARERLDSVLRQLDTIASRVAALSTPETALPEVAAESFQTLRTDVAEMDSLLDGIAEAQTRLGSVRQTAALVERSGRLAARVGDRADLARALTADLEAVERELRQLRAAAERLRLLPASTLFGPLERVVRDAARATGHRTEFRGLGGDIRLDGNVLSAVQSALVQIVRNSVAHGIETEDERVLTGKPKEGLVTLEITRRGNRIAFVCRDDGRGVDVESVRRALERKGRLPAGAPSPGERDLLRMLFDAGISTSGAVTDISGRGVGLDVVREVGARLGGRVDIETVQGKGTVVELVVPVSLSSLEGLAVEAAGLRAIIPFHAVQEVMRIDPSEGVGGDSFSCAGKWIPFLRLSDVLSARGALRPARAPIAAVVVKDNDRLIAIGVEHLRGRVTLLVRPIPSHTPLDAVVVGLSLDSEGNPQPVLDPSRLVSMAAEPRRALPDPVSPALPILVVDDSLTTRMLEQSILESAGFVVDLATSGEEALEKARGRRFGLFLVDVEMPGMNGFELLEHLRRDKDLRGIPSMLVTSRSTLEDRERGREVGARAYIVKGEFDQTALLEQIRSLLSRP